MCSGAHRAEFHERMCAEGRNLTIRVAERFSFIVDLNRKAYIEDSGMVHACPDPALHGESYALLAEAYSVVSVSETLF
jgi:hypothetical protein